jgi:oligopeptide/dipeptide ABC transporter ATP-binding protein
MDATTHDARLAAPVLFSASDLVVEFPRGDEKPLRAVDGFSLSIREGEFLSVLGATGCGKSTAALAMAGLVRAPGRIVSGRVDFLGRDLLALPEDERNAVRGRDIGLIVQNPRTSLHPLLKIGTQISNVIRAHNKVGAREAWQRAIEMLRLVGINDPERRARAYQHELSTGMTQRVMIAMALSSKPKLLIADEPTSGLDVTIQTQFLDQMWEAAQATGSAVVLVTQNLGITANYSDRVLVMQAGRIIESADVHAFFDAPVSEYSRRVLALRERGEGGTAHSADLAAGAALIDVRALGKQFDIRGTTAKVHAADDVSFSIRAGECLGLVGESGSGKTTTGRCLLQLEKPSSGDVLYRGRSLAGLSDAEFRPFRAKLQMVFQDPLDSMNPRWTVFQVIGELLALHSSLTGAARHQRVGELLELVGLDPRLQAVRPKDLSAGRQQRVAIARAIATDPDFIVLDEPTSALTADTTAEILSLLMELSKRLGLAYLFISHDLTTVRTICHNVAVMYLGQIVEIGSKEQVFNTPLHPYSKALLAAHLFPDLDHRRIDRRDGPALAGEIPSPIDLPKGCYLVGRCPSQLPQCAEQRQTLKKLPDGRSVRCWRVSEA